MAGDLTRCQQHLGPIYAENELGWRGLRHTSAHDKQDSRPWPGPAVPVSGDQVRDTWFWQPRHEVEGYDAAEVDDLVRRVAADSTPSGLPDRWLRTRRFERGNGERGMASTPSIGSLANPLDWLRLSRLCSVEGRGEAADPAV